jgi:hypothetical protein
MSKVVAQNEIHFGVVTDAKKGEIKNIVFKRGEELKGIAKEEIERLIANGSAIVQIEEVAAAQSLEGQGQGQGQGEGEGQGGGETK